MLDGGKGDKHPVVPPQMPAGGTGGQAIFDHQSYRQIHHAVGVVTPRWRQIGEVRIEVLATLGAVMLRIGNHKITRTPQVEIAQVVPRPLGLLVSIGHVTTTRTRVPSVVATRGNHLWLGQVGNRGDPFGGIGSIRTRTKHSFALLVPMVELKGYEKGFSGAISKPGKDAIVSHFTGF